MNNSELTCDEESFGGTECALKRPLEYELENEMSALKDPGARKGAYWQQQETKVWFRCTWCCDDQARFQGGTRQDYADAHANIG